MVSTMRNHKAIAVAPMHPVITPSRKKLCGRSAIGVLSCSSMLVVFLENTQPVDIYLATPGRRAGSECTAIVAPFSPFDAIPLSLLVPFQTLMLDNVLT